MSSSSADAPTPYIANTAADQRLMLDRIGLAEMADLFTEVPAAHRDPGIALPAPLGEWDLRQLFEERAGENEVAAPSFLGAGAYRRAVPAVTGALASRGEFVTPYTPYQPEISQGTLQAAFEFQSVVCELTGMEVANTGLYDVASATAEATLLAARVTGRRAVALLEPLHPHTVDVVRTYAFGAELRVDVVEGVEKVSEEHACLVAQQPDFLGRIRDLAPPAEAAHAREALCVAVVDPFALGLLRAPGEAGVDIVVGEGRDLAGPPSFGGPSLGLFATRQVYLRQMPGRIVGRTEEVARGEGERAPQTGYVLTLQAREQFIRRERATSNFSTGQALLALAFTISVEALGPQGLRQQAERCYQRAHAAAAAIGALPGYTIAEGGPWFQEFLVRGPVGAAELLRRLAERGIQGGVDVSARREPEAKEAVLVCVTEATPAAHVDRLVAALEAIGSEA